MKLLDQEFKMNVMNMVRGLMEKLDNMQIQVGNVSGLEV